MINIEKKSSKKTEFMLLNNESNVSWLVMNAYDQLSNVNVPKAINIGSNIRAMALFRITNRFTLLRNVETSVICPVFFVGECL